MVLVSLKMRVFSEDGGGILFKAGQTGADAAEIFFNIMNHADLIADLVHDMIHRGDCVTGILIQLCDDFLNIFSGLLGLLGEHADLLRDNSEPPACFPCARCFYSWRSRREDWSVRRSAG